MIKILLLLFLCVACTSVQQKLDPKVHYPKDMALNINGHQGVGTIVVPWAQLYKFQVTARGKLDLGTYSTCHREWYQESAWDDSDWFDDEHKMKFTFMPNAVERGYCPMQLGGYEKKKGRHSWALVDFEDGSATLPAQVHCNGNTYNSRGVTVCQSRAGLLQKIIFPVEVLTSPDKECPITKNKDGKEFEINLTRGECVYMFLEKDEKSNRIHRLTTYGYDEVILRED